jgi:sugar O-acyltransferase (sialic acid O-acetyltransferase NeuD family)
MAMKIVVFGAGDIARLAHHYFTHDSPHEVVAFTVDPEFRQADTFRGLPLVDSTEVARLFPPADHQMFVALSYAKVNDLRASKYQAFKQAGYSFASYVSTHCTYLSETPAGENCFILEDNTVQPFVTIGNNVTLWSGNHIGHDVRIDDHCFISSHVVLSGHVHVGERCFIGVNATLRNAITIAPRTVIGAGAVIMKDTRPGDVYIAGRTERFKKSSDEIEL